MVVVALVLRDQTIGMATIGSRTTQTVIRVEIHTIIRGKEVIVSKEQQLREVVDN